ncbi:hypothetical protein F5Y02DRAFT_416475 [Annulohypoxylon stygium]|nr:hypothetical protein F5Y02DRAFT_416475 [Annulohypoxylon stygium]
MISKGTVVHPDDPVPPGYTQVPPGCLYTTRGCLRKAREGGHEVFIVKTSKGLQSGVRVPISIHEQVKEDFEATKESRAKITEYRDRKEHDAFCMAIYPQFPDMPMDDASKAAARALKRGTRRVGRTRTIDIGEKVQLAVRAYARHKYTDYNTLLENGVSKDEARANIHEKLNSILTKWGGNPGESSIQEGDYSSDEIAKKIHRRQRLKHRFLMSTRARTHKLAIRPRRASSAPPDMQESVRTLSLGD